MKRLLLLCLLTLPAWAQDLPSSPEPTVEPTAEPASESIPTVEDVIQVEPLRAEAAAPSITEEHAPMQLEEIVVTATKRATSVREIPATVTALSGEDLEREGVQSIDQIVAQVPGVNLTDDGLGQAKRLTIRGVAADVNVNFTAGTLFGDIPFSDTFIPKVQLDPNPFDMATVEVLKGPQGTLFGGSGLNGMIRYVPEAPQFGETQVKYFAQYNNYIDDGDAGWTYGGVLNAPIGDDIAAVRLMAFHRDSPGFIDDTQSGKDDVNSTGQYGWRAMLGWHPTSDLRVNVMLVGQHSLQDDVAFTTNADGVLERSNTPRPSPVETDYKLANLGLEYAFTWADLISQTSFFEKEYQAFLDTSRIVPGGQIPILGIAGYNHSNAFVQELRLVSADDGDSPWKWLAGLFYYQNKLFDCSDGALDLPGLPIYPLPGILAKPCEQNMARAGDKIVAIHLAGDLSLTEKAVFGELTRRFGERTEVTLGARYYQTGSEGDITTAGALYVAQTGGTQTVRHGDVDESGISPKLSISVHVTDDILSYLTASRGFRFGGIQLNTSTLTTQVPETFDSDSLWSYELGVRSQWFDRTLYLDTSVYFIDWTDPQVFQQTADGLATFIDNVGGVNGSGAELSLRWLVPFLNGLTLSASASYNDTYTTEDFRSSTGVDVPSGSPWPLSPRWQTSSSIAYVLPLESWKAVAAVRHTYSSEACNAIECGAMVFDYNTVDANLSLSSLNLPWLPELSLGLSNLSNERGLSNVSNNPTLGDTYSYIPPRMLTVRLSGNF